MSDSIKTTGRTWIEDGILYFEFHGQHALGSIVEIERRASQLVKERQINHLPTIVILDQTEEGTAKIGIADFAKMITSAGVVKHLSGILIVGGGEQATKTIGMLNKFFFSGRIHFFDTLEKAQVAARAIISSDVSILEQK